MNDLEQKSATLGADRKALERRLRSTRSLLYPDIKRAFGRGKFDFRNQRLIGNNFSLQWQIRDYPNKPIDYHNQQTSIGTVCIMFNDS